MGVRFVRGGARMKPLGVPRSTASDAHAPPPAPPGQPRLLRRGFGWLLMHVRDLRAALGIYLVVGFALLFGGVAAFAALADEVGEGATQAFDNAVLLWLNARATPTLDEFALEMSAIGAGLPVLLVLLLASAFLWTSRHRYSVLLLWTAVVGGEILNILLKNTFDRPRPRLFPWRTPMAAMSSFPSGHAMTGMIVYMTLAYLLARLAPNRVMRRLTYGVAVVLVLGIGWSRLYLGVHYPSDVAAGYAAGFAWATFCALGLEAVRFFRTHPKVAHQERDLARPATPIS